MRRRVARQHPLEDLRLAADVELGGRLVEQHQPGARADGAERPGQRDPLPLPAGQVGAARVALGQRACRGRPARRRRRRRAPPGSPRRSPPRPGATLSRSGSSKRTKSWNTAVTRARQRVEVEVAQVDAVDLDRARRPGRTAGTAAWPASSCRRRSGRRSPATSRPGSSGRARRRPGGRCRGSRTRRRGTGSPAPARPSAGAAGAGRQRAARAPSPRSSRSTAATGAAAPSSAQFSPPNGDQADADGGLGEHHQLVQGQAARRSRRPPARRRRRRCATSTIARHSSTGRSRSRVAAYCSSNSLRRRATNRSTVQPARPNSRSSLAGGGSTASRYA